MRKHLGALVLTALSAHAGRICNAPTDRIEAVHCIAESLAKNEGWDNPHSLIRRLHNPGALVFRHQRGATKGMGSIYAAWKTDAEGWAALYRDLLAKLAYRITLAKLMRTWATGKGYLAELVADTGYVPEAVLP